MRPAFHPPSMRRPFALLLIAAAALTALFLLPGASAADGNDFWPTATPISPGVWGPYDINPSGDVDWYSFNLTQAGTISVSTNGSNGSTFLSLYDASLYNVAYDDGTVTPWSHLRYFALPGEYFAVVSAGGGNSTFYNYTLKLAFTPVVILAQGVNGPYNTNNTTKIDWFQFNLTQRSTYVLQTNGSAGDSAVWIYDSYFNNVDYDYGASTPWTRLRGFLSTGIYYVSVASTVYDTPLIGYTVRLDTASPVPLANGSNGPFNASSTFAPNWFAFGVYESQMVRLVVPSSSVSMEIVLYDSTMSYVTGDSYGNSTAALRLLLTLDPGNYYVVVYLSYAPDFGSDYLLVFDRAPPEGFDGNGLQGSAAALPFGLNGPFDIDPARDLDWYYFTLPTQGVVEITFAGGGWGTTLSLYDDNGTLINSTSSYYSPGLLVEMLGAGRSYILVDASSAVIYGYTIDIAFTPPPPPDHNDDAKNATAARVGDMGPFSLYLDDADWYTFVADVPGTIRAESWGPRGGAELVLYDHSVSPIASGQSTGNYSFQVVSLAVDLGTYYIRVTRPSWDLAVGEYNLTITFTPWVSLDGNDFGSQARRIAFGLNGPYSLHPATDFDWYWFDAQDPGDTTIEVMGTNTDVTLVLYNSSWQQVAIAQYASQSLFAENQAPGRFYLRVSTTYGYGDIDSYRLNLTIPDLRAPPLLISGPQNGTLVSTGSVRVSGVAEPGARVWVDGLEVNVNATGAFTRVVIVPVGENDITILARDQTGNEAQTFVTVIGVDPNDQVRAEVTQLSGELNSTQQQLSTTQQQLTAVQAAAAAQAATQAASANATAEHLQSQLNAANASIEAARIEAGAQRSLALMGMVLGAVAVAAAVVVGLLGRRRAPGPTATVATVLPARDLTATEARKEQ